MITYNNTFNKVHNVGVTLLQTASKWNYEGASMTAENVPQNIYLWNAMGEIKPTDEVNKAGWSTSLVERQLESYMIRINYAYNDRYLLTASGRWDGASQLSKGRKWAFFPSMSLGWRIQQESFLRDVTWLNNLKIRAGVGTTGNSATAPYSTLGAIQSIICTDSHRLQPGLRYQRANIFQRQPDNGQHRSRLGENNPMEYRC